MLNVSVWFFHLCCLFFFLMVLGFELGALCLLTNTLPLEPPHQPFFVLDIFKIGLQELFAWAGFEV
jgi:hypothetical protein